MNKLTPEYGENVRHRKKSKTSRTSKSVHHSNHKHEYEKIIIREFIGYAWSARCKLCGKFQSHHRHFSASLYTDFRRPEFLGQSWISDESFFKLDEIRAKFPNVPIYEFSYEDMQYHLVP